MTNNGSIKLFNGKFKSEEDAIKAYYQYGLGYLKLPIPEISNALSHLNAALSRSTKTVNKYPEIYAAKGEALRIKGDYEESIKCFDNALKHFKDEDIRKPFCFFGKYQSLKELGRYDEASSSIDAAISLKPDVRLFTDEKESILELTQQSESLSSDSECLSESGSSDSTEARTLSRKLSVKNILNFLSRKSKSDTSSTSSEEDTFSLSFIDEEFEDGNVDYDGDVFMAGEASDVFCEQSSH